MEIEEKELQEKVARVRVDTAKSILRMRRTFTAIVSARADASLG